MGPRMSARSHPVLRSSCKGNGKDKLHTLTPSTYQTLGLLQSEVLAKPPPCPGHDSENLWVSPMQTCAGREQEHSVWYPAWTQATELTDSLPSGRGQGGPGCSSPPFWLFQFPAPAPPAACSLAAGSAPSLGGVHSLRLLCAPCIPHPVSCDKGQVNRWPLDPPEGQYVKAPKLQREVQIQKAH